MADIGHQTYNPRKDETLQCSTLPRQATPANTRRLDIDMGLASPYQYQLELAVLGSKLPTHSSPLKFIYLDFTWLLVHVSYHIILKRT